MERLAASRSIPVKRRGQTLIESIIALAIFSFVAASFASLMLGGLSGVGQGFEEFHASILADEGLEAVRSIRDRAFNELRYAASGISVSQNAWIFDGEGTSNIVVPFTRQIRIAPVCRSQNDDITSCPGSYTDSETLLVTSRVSWTGREGTVRSIEHLSYENTWDASTWTQTDWAGGPGQAIWSDQTKYNSDDGNSALSPAGQIQLRSVFSVGTWSLFSSPIDDERIRSISAVSASDIWAVGDSGKIIRYNGTSWSVVTDVGSATLYGIAMVSASEGWAVGSSGKIYRYNGTSWIEFADVGSQDLRAVSMLTSSYGWAVGGNGSIYRFNGTAWVLTSSPVTQQLNAVRVLSATDAWIGADSGKFLHYNGTSWTEVTDLGGNNVESLSFVSAVSAWGGGQNGEIYRYNGTSWSIVSDTGNEVWGAIALPVESDGWILGTGGAIRHWNGSAWSIVSSPTPRDIHAVVMLDAQSGWAVGDQGTILRYTGGPSGYVSDAWITSSAFSMSNASPVQYISWDQIVPSCTPSCFVRLQVRTAPDNGGVPGVYTQWYGAQGAGTYFTNASGTLIPIELNGNTWVQYRVELHGDAAQTPVLQEVRINYK